MKRNEKEQFKCLLAAGDKLTVITIGDDVHIEAHTDGHRKIEVVLHGSEFKRFVATINEIALEQMEAEKEANKSNKAPRRKRYSSLTDQAQLVFRHMCRAGSISAREAMNDHGITSATLARRICDIEVEGFKVNRERRVHPITQKQYTRYSLAE